MVDSKAEEDDEEGFGDFTFASSFSTSTLHSDQINGPKSTIHNGDDDDWGDFVESPLRSTALVSSKPSEPFGFFSDQSQLTTESASTLAEPAKTQWVKPKGALPLSLFGDVEQEEEESGVVDPPFKNSAVDIKTESNSERISNLYSKVQPIKAENGFDSNSNVSDPKVIEKNPILNGASSRGMDSILNLFAGNDDIQSPQIDTASGVSLNKEFFSGGNTVESQLIKAVSGLNTDSDWFGGQQIKEDQLNTSSSVLVGMDSYSDPLGGSEELDGDDDGWEFKDASSDFKAEVGSDKVGGKDERNFAVTGLSFDFGNHSHGSNLFPSSNGFSFQPREVDHSFDIKPATVAQNGFSSNSLSKIEQNGTVNGSDSDHVVGTFGPDESFGDFESASTETGLNQEVNGKDEENFGVTGLSFEFGNVSHGSDLFLSSNGFSAQPREVDISFDLKPLTVTQNGFSSDSFFISEQHGAENGLNSDPVVGLVESDESFGDFEGAFTEAGLNQEGNETISNNHKGALPLSIFGDDELETDDSPNVQGAFTFKPCYPRNGLNSQGSNIPINDLISNLYSQAEQIPPVESTGIHTGNGLDSSDEVKDLSTMNSDDDFEDASWDFKDASIQTSSVDELMKHATSMVDVLRVGSAEDQGTYVYTWSKMISVCAQELKHGSWIWKQLVEKNIQSEILSEPRGKGFILALGEIYRVVAVLGASAKLCKPWILSSSIDSTSIYTLLEECYTLWSTSGMEKALQDIYDPIDLEYHSTVKALRDSIRFIHGHDELTLGNHILNQQVSVCRLSLLNSEAVPDIKLVLWNGKYYFLPLANLWANLISCDPPELPYLDVGS
ncbi:hypothetical protein Vadar_001102 [Vaccinium darrowii]|uniref:Uncharacterized protein n=1 Tax=Vaccinium darrowii TaxID=229202 RepID=A0ACB7XWM2_9ERIC|nr:hypothetical protein Vadar_001102 [Vaccinium darrowii]